MSYETILFDVEENVATVTMNRPEAMNALNMQLGEELVDAMTRCRSDANVRAVVLKGAGRAFCAGGDLKAFSEFLQADPVTAFRTFASKLHVGIVEVRHMEKPVIAQVHGVAAGAGMSLALACDLTIAAESARFIMAYRRVGLSPTAAPPISSPAWLDPRRRWRSSIWATPSPHRRPSGWG